MHIDLKHKKFLTIAAVILLFVILPVLRYLVFVGSPAGTGRTVRIFDLSKGTSLKHIATDLEGARIVSSARLFVLQARLKGDTERLQAGEYRFNDGMAPREILRMMVAGEVYARKFTLPEGYSIYQIAELLDERHILDGHRFLQQARNPALLRELGIGGASVEGYLYPSTYQVTAKMDEAALIRLMVAQFDKVFADKFAVLAKQHAMSPREAVTLASLIEKEAVVPGERALISSVFHNRLRKKMRLQSDPTAVYGIRAFSGPVTKQDILRKTPYNTYLIDGLPPGPIGNPGSAAIAAALSPATSPYLYFVAKNDGTHYFSTTLAEHNDAVRTYLKTSHGIRTTASTVAEIRNDRPHLAGRR
ncbi:aminodeoxychorismate lyase [Geotalea uraniireducens]|uniref:Endolytic murein transglycosylase n=1 Tax=Geotalea uraniireducens TaxID=351604 RepID=A0ABM8EGV1_9BACT|nr:endolytic transglycosylase MltG [Geotalea uraniireducens]BDV41659.1 aminodeoxychorismate lyase [Geotalea uraniireducens]